MIDVYAFATPNSLKIPIALEELGLAYRLIPVNPRNGEQKSADFTAINANAKVPVVVDRNVPGNEPVTLSESGAILLYLAEKFGVSCLPLPCCARASLRSFSFTPQALAPLSRTAFSKGSRRPPIPKRRHAPWLKRSAL